MFHLTRIGFEPFHLVSNHIGTDIKELKETVSRDSQIELKKSKGNRDRIRSKCEIFGNVGTRVERP